MNLLGKISLTLSVLCILVTGGFKLSIPGWIPFIGWGIGFGLFFFVFGILINFRYFIRILTSDGSKFIGKSLAQVSILLGILIVLNFIVAKKNFVKDLTDNKIHSLSPLSEALVKALPEPLTFHYFHSGNENVKGFETLVRTQLEPYMNLSPMVQFQSYSVFKRPELAKKFKTGNEESTLYVEFKDRIQRVSELSEISVTNSILKVSKPLKKIYFVEGHEERRIDDPSTFGLKGVREQLERLHYKVEKLPNLMKIPKDVAVLVLAGPRLKLADQESEVLNRFIDDGGALLIAVDPGEPHELNPFIRKYGIELGGGYAATNSKQVGQSEFLVFGHPGKPPHEIAKDLVDASAPSFFIASNLKLMEGDSSFKVNRLIEHMPGNSIKKDLDPAAQIIKDQSMVLGAMSEGRSASLFRLAVIADSDFLTNQYFSRPGNFDFILSLVTYLSRDEDLLKMQSPVAKTTYLVITDTQMSLYFLFFVVPFILLFFIAAIFFKLRRHF